MKHLILILGLVSFGVNANEQLTDEFKALGGASMRVINMMCQKYHDDLEDQADCFDKYADLVREEFVARMEGSTKE
ncbi:hypothetical protein LAB19_001677 [Salmonella enterica subsp. enterica serovar Manhattan]|nr:hypothetical protein [Salmonella enterica subsp. enterica serovar Manhattan]